MPKPPAAPERQLLADNADLRARLEKAQQTLREILSGEADALFVAGAGGTQLFTLKDTDQPYRTLVEDMSEGALTMTAQGVVLYANRRFAEMVRMPLEKVIGTAISTWFASDQQATLSALLNSGPLDQRRQEMELLASDMTRVPVFLSVSHLRVKGRPDAFALVVTDLTEQRKNEDVAASEKQARELLAAANQSRRVLLSVIEDQKRAEESIRLQAHMLDTIGQAVIATDRDGVITYANRFVETLYGWAPADMVGRRILEVTVPAIGHVQAEQILMQLQRGESWSGEFQVRHRNGRQFPALVTNTPLQDPQGQLTGIIGISTDITAQKLAETRIKRLNRVHAVLSGINTLIVRVRDRDELFRESCRVAVEDGGFRMSLIAIVNQRTAKIEPLASAGVDDALLADIKAILASPERAPTTMVHRAIREKKTVLANNSKDDPQVVFGQKYADIGVRSMVVLPLIVAGEAIGVLALYSEEAGFFDEEELKLLIELAGDTAFAIDHLNKQERLDYLAYYDVLTGLANRSLFLDRVGQCMRSAVSAGHQLAVILFDLERFKSINDSLGRPAGDALLRQVAQWLTHNAGGDASLLARVGADHFAAILPVLRQDGNVVRLIEKTIAAIADHPFRLNDAVFRVAAKVGIALFPQDGGDADTLFRNAEAALKRAKASGERYLFYTQTMTATVAARLSLENQLRQAIDQEEFVLHYQPKVNLASGKVTSAEALIRWNHPRTGLVPPGHFIPILEETGLIHEVGRWALRQAVKDCLRWRAAGLAVVRIAVNVSPLQLRHRNFIAEVEEAIGVDAQAAAGLELEITESLIMADVQGSIASLAAIRAMGISIAIDDFGTGFSSLSYLAKLPVDTLKIDRSFVIDMTTGPEGLALVSTIISLAHALKLKVVAEGVETEEQSRLLHVLNCDEIQGYVFSQPVPRGIFEANFLARLPARDD